MFDIGQIILSGITGVLLISAVTALPDHFEFTPCPIYLTVPVNSCQQTWGKGTG